MAIKRLWHGWTTPDAAQKVLKRWDQTSDHYEVRETRDYG